MTCNRPRLSTAQRTSLNLRPSNLTVRSLRQKSRSAQGTYRNPLLVAQPGQSGNPKESSTEAILSIPELELLYGILSRATAIMSKDIFGRKSMKRWRRHSRHRNSCEDCLPDGTDTASIGVVRSGAPSSVTLFRKHYMRLNIGDSNQTTLHDD